MGLWIPGVPRDPSPSLWRGGIAIWAEIAHFTYGGWSGSYSVGKGSRYPVGFQLLIGKGEGQWVQFGPIDTMMYHAKGANSWSSGIEMVGRNGDAFTDWQARSAAYCLSHIGAALGVPMVYRDAGRVGKTRGVLAHNAVAGSDHTDRWGWDNWNKVVTYLQGSDMTPEQAAALARCDARTNNIQGSVAQYDQMLKTHLHSEGKPPFGGELTDVIQRVKNLEAGLSRMETKLDQLLNQ